MKERDSIPSPAWDHILEKINYPQILEQESGQFGAKPLRRLGYNKYESFNQGIEKVTKILNARIQKINEARSTAYPLLGPGFLSAVVLQEGLAEQIDNYGYEGDHEIDTFGQIGLDSLGTDRARLISEGLLRESFNKKKSKSGRYSLENQFEMEIFGKISAHSGSSNERGMPVDTLYVTEEEAIEGVGAVLVDKIMYLINNVGIERWSEFSGDEQRWLAYAAYQWGQGNVLQLLNKIPYESLIATNTT